MSEAQRYQEKVFEAIEAGKTIGQSIALIVVSEGILRKWREIEPHEYIDPLIAAGLWPDTPEWDAAVETVREAYEVEIEENINRN